MTKGHIFAFSSPYPETERFCALPICRYSVTLFALCNDVADKYL